MKGSYKIGEIAGIGIYMHWSFSLLIAYIIFINYKSGNSPIQIAWTVLFILSIFATVVLHELGHAIAAKNFNIKTKDITLLPIGGIARLESLPEKPKEELIVAIAGPLVNVTLAILTGFFINFPDNPEELTLQLSKGINAHTFFLNFYLVNIFLAIFNMLPAFPMDGGRVLRALLGFKYEKHIATRIAARIGQFLALGFMILGFFVNPFLIFIGIFVIMGAQMEAEYTQSKFVLKGFRVRDVLMKQYQTIDADEPLKTAVTLLLDSQSKNFLITKDNEAIGTLNRDQIIMGLSANGEDVPIHTVMNRNLIFLDADSQLENVFELVYKNKTNLLLVMENNELVGTLDTENLVEFLLIKEVKSKKAYAK